jgi:hypothetical protein
MRANTKGLLDLPGRATLAGVALGFASLGGLGCASTDALKDAGEADFSSTQHHSIPSVRVGEAQVVASRIDPRTPVGVEAGGGDLSVRFARRGHLSVSTLDTTTLKPHSTERDWDATSESGPPGSTRVVLDDGHFVVLWTRPSVEWGNRALAQTFNASGWPLGAPVVISPRDADVVGTPRAVTTDGRHVVATFAAATDGTFAVLAVPIDDATRVEATAPIAGR